ncbi:RNA polymerase sigma-70 factor [Bacteroides sp.]|uniref:RNA polymerase sigma-70 factor n=1 Tax=Bacteroides sp. TaxID=29523 RepID=UPI00257C9CFB|nr:RNA polymerase sigma-70 factor [Bacteroides sp.]
MALNLIKKDKSRSVVSIKLDEHEFHNIFKEYYAALCSFAFQYMEDADMSADIVQDVFAKLWQIRDDFFYLHQVKAFLYTAVRNHALNELEHSKVAHEYEQKIIAKKTDASFRDAIVEEETFRILSEAIEKLPTQMRAIMQLALEGKKNAEIAERLNVSPETVHTLKKVAYKKLRAFLTDYYYYYCLLLFI